MLRVQKLTNGLLRCVARASYGVGLRSLGVAAAGLVGEIAAEVVLQIGDRAWAFWRSKNPAAGDRQADLEALAQASTSEIQDAARVIVAEEAADASPDEREALTRYLTQLPPMIRRSLRTPSDPTGRTVAPTAVPRAPEDLQPLLPRRMSRFREGQPLPGNSDWQLVTLLGIGGFGEVWLARNSHLGDTSAIKFCLDASAAASLRRDAELLARVRREARHPGIVALEDTQLSGETPYLRLEFVEGGDLTCLIAEEHANSQLSKRERTERMLARFCELLDIVAHCHALEPAIVHRDLKPANILVQAVRSGPPRLRVTDFGIGSAGTQQSILKASTGNTSRGDFLATSLRGAYTPLYASPQQMRGLDPDPADDVFSLGVILLQMLTGDTTLGAPTGDDWKDELRDRAGVDDGLIQLLGKCWSHKRESRPKDAIELRARLEALGFSHAASGDDTGTTPASNRSASTSTRPADSVIRRVLRDWISSVDGKWDDAGFQRFLVSRFLRQPGFHLITETEARDLALRYTAEWRDDRAKQLETERLALEQARQRREQEDSERREAERLRKCREFEAEAGACEARGEHDRAATLYAQVAEIASNPDRWRERAVVAAEKSIDSLRTTAETLATAGRFAEALAAVDHVEKTVRSSQAKAKLREIRQAIATRSRLWTESLDEWRTLCGGGITALRKLDQLLQSSHTQFGAITEFQALREQCRRRTADLEATRSKTLTRSAGIGVAIAVGTAISLWLLGLAADALAPNPFSFSGYAEFSTQLNGYVPKAPEGIGTGLVWFFVTAILGFAFPPLWIATLILMFVVGGTAFVYLITWALILLGAAVGYSAVTIAALFYAVYYGVRVALSATVATTGHPLIAALIAVLLGATIAYTLYRRQAHAIA